MPIHYATMLCRTAALLALLLFAPGLGAEELPTPASLEPAVRFWTRVYTEVDTRSGLIHDSENLSVVYETVRFPGGLSHRAREQRIEASKRKIRAALGELAKGKRSGLSADEARVLAQWPSGVSNATLRQAVDRVRFQLGQSDKFREGLVRAGAFRAHVEKALARHGVPPELVALPHVESSYNTKAYSRVGAAGMWQFTRSTGRMYMRVDSVVDERLDPFIASDAAARLLAKNREITGAWPLAITAYNHGAGGMRRAARTLGTTDIGEIVRRYKSRSFGFASRNFYTSFLAASRIDRDPRRHFGEFAPHVPISYAEFQVPFFTPADALAEALQVDLTLLREHNPALRGGVWNGGKHVPSGVTLRVPQGLLRAPPSTLLASIPRSARLAEQDRDTYHKVRRGETLSRIARSYGVGESELMSLNNLRSRHRIQVGQVLVLPDRVGGRVQVAQQPLPADGVYRVQAGDTLSRIAARYGTSESALVAANGIRNRHQLVVGQRLRMPGEPVVVASNDAEAPVLPARRPAEAAAAAENAAEATEAEIVAASAAEAVPPVAPVPGAAEPPAVEPEPVEPEIGELGAPEPESVRAEPAAPTPAQPEVGAEPVEPVPAPPESEPPPAALPPEGAATADPSDYSVHGNRITVQAAETLGHYAEWLEVRASRLRQLNRLRFEQPVVIGRSLKLDFARVTPQEFEQRRLEYHQSLQNEFFEAFVVTGTERHVLAPGETLWYLAQRKYRVPVWLLRQYNPDLDFGALSAGATMVVPMVEPKTS